jgi:hypothetical protein
MPAKDHYHDVVKRALAKDGWTITAEQHFIKLPERRFWVDLQAGLQNENQRIFIEVKSFRNVPSPVESLAASVGKYVIYRVALDRLRDTTPLWLAIPQTAYRGIFSQAIGQAVIKRLGVSLIVYDIEREVIVRWIP